MVDKDYKDWVFARAKEMRENPTEAELRFLKWVRKNFASTPSHQAPVLVDGKYYIIDFLFKKAGIAIEIDGGIHYKQIDKDKNRDNILFDKLGIYTIRIDNYHCYPKFLNQRLRSKLEYAQQVQDKKGKKTRKIYAKKKSKKQLTKEYHSKIGNIMDWVRRCTPTPEKDVRQFAINIYNKKYGKFDKSA